jgi:limonene-1,2-epoxide hydrolase
MSQQVETIAQPLSKKVADMVTVLMAHKWDEFQTFFSKDLFYKVGAAPPVHGPQAASDFLAGVYTKLNFTGHDIRGMWEIDNVVIIEMDANYTAIADGSFVQVPCCDIYRFDENGLINEWRVYPDASNTAKFLAMA